LLDHFQKANTQLTGVSGDPFGFLHLLSFPSFNEAIEQLDLNSLSSLEIESLITND